MSYWHRCLPIMGWALIGGIFAWELPAAGKSSSSRVAGVAIIFALALTGGLLSYLETRRFLASKICYLVIAALCVKLFLGLSRDDFANQIFIVLFFPALLSPEWPRSRFRVHEWWPAMRRTIRRLRGGWREDEERFVSETIGKSK